MAIEYHLFLFQVCAYFFDIQEIVNLFIVYPC